MSFGFSGNPSGRGRGGGGGSDFHADLGSFVFPPQQGSSSPSGHTVAASHGHSNPSAGGWRGGAGGGGGGYRGRGGGGLNRGRGGGGRGFGGNQPYSGPPRSSGASTNAADGQGGRPPPYAQAWGHGNGSEAGGNGGRGEESVPSSAVLPSPASVGGSVQPHRLASFAQPVSTTPVFASSHNSSSSLSSSSSFTGAAAAAPAFGGGVGSRAPPPPPPPPTHAPSPFSLLSSSANVTTGPGNSGVVATGMPPPAAAPNLSPSLSLFGSAARSQGPSFTNSSSEATPPTRSTFAFRGDGTGESRPGPSSMASAPTPSQGAFPATAAAPSVPFAGSQPMTTTPIFSSAPVSSSPFAAVSTSQPTTTTTPSSSAFGASAAPPPPLPSLSGGSLQPPAVPQTSPKQPALVPTGVSTTSLVNSLFGAAAASQSTRSAPPSVSASLTGKSLSTAAAAPPSQPPVVTPSTSAFTSAASTGSAFGSAPSQSVFAAAAAAAPALAPSSVFGKAAARPAVPPFAAPTSAASAVSSAFAASTASPFTSGAAGDSRKRVSERGDHREEEPRGRPRGRHEEDGEAEEDEEDDYTGGGSDEEGDRGSSADYSDEDGDDGGSASDTADGDGNDGGNSANDDDGSTRGGGQGARSDLEGDTTAGASGSRRPSPPQPPAQPSQPTHNKEDASVSALEARQRRFQMEPASAGPAAAPSWQPPLPRSQVQQQQQHHHQPSPFAAGHTASSVARPSASAAAAAPLVVPTVQDEKKLCLAARVWASFLRKIAVPRESEEAWKDMETAFFGAAGKVGVYGSFRRTASEMLAVWQREQGRVALFEKMRGEVWVATFALGSHLNLLMSTIEERDAGGSTSPPPSASTSNMSADLIALKASISANPYDALSDACQYANQLNDLLLELFQRDEEMLTPYSILPLVLQRVRTVFEEATRRGVTKTQSNARTVTSKLFSILNKRVKATVVQYEQAKDRTKWILISESESQRQLILSFAHLVCEMMMCEAPSIEDMEYFMAAFHKYCPSALEERCTLYYVKANLLIQQPLTMRRVSEAAELFAQALVTCPDDGSAAARENRRLLQLKLVATELALGRVPNKEQLDAFRVPQLIDVVAALRSANLELFDIAQRNNAVFFVESGIHNVLQVVRERIALLMVVKYYVSRRGEGGPLRVPDMMAYFNLPYTSTMEAMVVWLLPLLIKMQINGVLDRESLVLSGMRPFDDYAKNELLAVAADEYGSG